VIVLASTSRYRRELLQRLQLPFEVHPPQVDETPLPNEAPRELALRLALDKASNVAVRFAGAIVIGSDQTAELSGMMIGKPHTHAAALAQLESMQGRQVVFHSALAVIDAAGHSQVDCVPTTVTFRSSTRDQLERYLRADQPYDCTGSAKIESFGIALAERVESTDPTALIGLPLIRLTSMLAIAGVDVLAG
jgi:septum formation protein